MARRSVTSAFRKTILATLLVLPLIVVVTGSHNFAAAAGPCTAPTTDYGTVTQTVNVPGTGTYRIWSRMSAPSSTANTYMLEIDANSCYTIGGSTIPTYASGATTFFANDTSNWISKTSAGTQVDVSLTSGNHTFKLIGNADGVVLDRLVLTQDTSCVPTGTGDNCANPPDTTAPTVSITAPTNGTTISGTTTVSASATDDVAVSKVEFYVDGTLKSTDTSSPYSFSLLSSSLTTGSHTLTAKAYDTSNNSTTSAAVGVTVGAGSGLIAEDINQDGHVTIADFNILAANYGKSGASITNTRADIDGNGTVNIADFNRLAAKYGT